MSPVSSLSEIKADWWNSIATKNALNVPFYSYEWHRTWYKVFGANIECWIFHDENTLAPLVKTGSTLTFSGGKEICDYMDMVGPDEKKPEAWSHILSYAKSHDITSIVLPNIPESSTSLSYFQKEKGYVISTEKEDTTPILTLPTSWDAYLSKLPRHNRHELRRKLKIFQNSHQDSAIIESKNPRDDIHFLFDLMSQDLAKKNFLDDRMQEFFSKIVTALSREVSLVFLTVRNTRVAAILEFTKDAVTYLYNSGFNEAEFSGAGFYLKAKAIEQAIAKDVKQYNFLQGGERYKYDLGAHDFFVYTVTINLAA